METNLKRAIDIAERLQHVCAATTGKLETLDTVIAEMKFHEAEHAWIFSRLDRLVEIYNLVGADGAQCVDRIKCNFQKSKMMREALSEIYEYGSGKAQDTARIALEKL